MRRGPRIAVTPGDPRGVGPEVAWRAASTLLGADGDDGAAELFLALPDGLVPWSELPDDPAPLWPEARSDEAAGRIAGGAIEQAVAAAMAGTVHAIVTAPIHKPSLHAAGWHVPGHTELLRDLSGAPAVGMLMAAERTRLDAPLRVLLATTHVALRAVPDLLTEDRIVEQATLLADALRRDWAIPEPRLALCALNPHASDGGLFGDEEARVLEPARARLEAAGVRAGPPLPADTVFARTLGGDFDAVVAPYHDVGMAAFKTVSFGSGVNVTLGLPFVRTSPDHGTAFDIAGTGRADAGSMEEALRLAARLARGRFGPAGALA